MSYIPDRPVARLERGSGDLSIDFFRKHMGSASWTLEVDRGVV